MVTWLRRVLVTLLVLGVVSLAGLIGFGYWFARGDRAGAARAAMKTDLRNLAAAESLFYAGHGHYSGLFDSLRVGDRPYRTSDIVRLYITRADRQGWHAVASNALTDELCRMSGWAPGTDPSGADTALARPLCR